MDHGIYGGYERMTHLIVSRLEVARIDYSLNDKPRCLLCYSQLFLVSILICNIP
jgi:hypothetical protein